MNKNTIITRLLKEDKITLEEAMILYNDNPYIPYAPYINPLDWTVTCGDFAITSSDSVEYRKSYDPEEYKEKH